MTVSEPIDRTRSRESETVAPQALTKSAREKLKQLVRAIEALEAEKRESAGAIKESYAEAKALGFDPKALRAVIRLRAQDRDERERDEQIRTLYLHALGEI